LSHEPAKRRVVDGVEGWRLLSRAMRSKGKTFLCPLSKLSLDSQLLVKSLAEFQSAGS